MDHADNPALEPVRQGRRRQAVVLFLFFSGLGGLVLEMSWLRELTLVFGSSTAATAVVLAVFMGGLGLGGWLLGRRADHQANPLRHYAWLLLLIAATAAPSPFLIDLGRRLYVLLGGQTTLGLFGATAMRLLMSVLILGLPAIVMGGTLPVAARALTPVEDTNRRGVALLYGMNELGAVLGIGLSTFYTLEHWGIRATLWSACGIYLLTSLAAFVLAGRTGRGDMTPAPAAPPPAKQSDPEAGADATPPVLIYVAAGIAGAAFFLMEMVWYRMLAPILGGTTFTFGLILMMALAGIGIGGALYTLVLRGTRPTLSALALTCALEAACLAIPFALGDRLAILAVVLRGMGSMGFATTVTCWAVIVLVVVLPAAVAAGIQFPLLIALLGSGQRHVGRQVGGVVAWNTVGAVAGSLGGGFGLLPLLTAPGVWRAAVGILTLLAGLLLVWPSPSGRTRYGRLPATVLAMTAILLIMAGGPSAVWRHSGIGAGRAKLVDWSYNSLRDVISLQQRSVLWEADGIESSVAVVGGDGLALYVNGKCDGNAVHDAPMQIMGGLIQALLHPAPRSSLVIGLGTGETAGWLAQVPQMQRVDVVEIEPAVCQMARRCAAANGAVLDNPKVHLTFNDAREVVLTSPRRYDLIFSEPSNPYRRGVASLYTREFYQDVRARLNPGGLFMQWLQAYEIEAQSVCTVLATLRDSFAHVEVWRAGAEDLIMLCSCGPIPYDAVALRERVAQEPYRSALLHTWGVRGVEGFLSHFVLGPEYATALRSDPAFQLNTDDRNVLEYAFARAVGQPTGLLAKDLARVAALGGQGRPAMVAGAVDWNLVADYAQARDLAETGEGTPTPQPTDIQKHRAVIFDALKRDDIQSAVTYWEQHRYELVVPTDLAALCLAYAKLGDDKMLPLADELEKLNPVDANAMRAVLAIHQRRAAAACHFLAAACRGLQAQPWQLTPTFLNYFPQASQLAAQDPGGARELYESLREPFAVNVADDLRLWVRLCVADTVGLPQALESIRAFQEPAPWTERFLHARRAILEAANDPGALDARRDLEDFMRHQPQHLPTPPMGAGHTGP